MIKEMGSAADVLKDIFKSAIRAGDLLLTFNFPVSEDAYKFVSLLELSDIILPYWMPDTIEIRWSVHDRINKKGEVTLARSAKVEILAGRKK